MEHPDPESKELEGDESLFHDLELRYISLRNEYDSMHAERNNLQGERANKCRDV
jgi:hypothetical protein